MDISQYRNFIVIAEAKTISAAAVKLCIAQTALSNQIRSIEAEYGAELLARGRGVRSIRLTQAGEIFYNHAKALCRLEENLRQDIGDCVRGVSGTLKISLSSSRGKILIRKIISSFRQDFPDVRYQLLEGSVREQENQLLSGLSELGIANAPLTRPELFDCLYRRKEYIYAAARNPRDLPEEETLHLADLAALPLCVSAACHKLLRERMLLANLPYRPLAISSRRQTTAEWAAAGLGIAVIPGEAVDFPYDDLFYKRIDEPELCVYKTIFKAKDKQLSRLARAFLLYYEKNCAGGTEKTT